VRPLRVCVAVAIAAGTFVAVACSVDVDLSNKACPCGDGYVCDTARNLCVLPQDLPADSGAEIDAKPPCIDGECPCTVDGDCTEPGRTKCSPEKTCVECNREPDTCPASNYCNEEHQCTLGCKAESDCQISPNNPHCNLERHQCVECLTASQCGDAGLLCSPGGACVQGCDLDAGRGCTTGTECCENLCLDTKIDPLNCGSCGRICSTSNATATCVAGSCTFACADGFGHCATGNTGCETNLRSDPTKCGSCTRNCFGITQNANGVFCNVGSCDFTTCKTNFGNCDGITFNGCECACGGFVGQECCPGDVCWFPGGRCVGSGTGKKCQ
jgi:hypothetical protein